MAESYKSTWSQTSVNYNNDLIKYVDNLQRIRHYHIDQYNESFDPSTFTYTMKEPPDIDNIGKQIKKILRERSRELPFEFIMEQITHLGPAVSILYDDNGHFAASADGFQEVPSGDEPEDITLSAYVSQDMWKDTPREALEYFLQDLK